MNQAEDSAWNWVVLFGNGGMPCDTWGRSGLTNREEMGRKKWDGRNGREEVGGKKWAGRTRGDKRRRGGGIF